jgi:hypothetical protein
MFHHGNVFSMCAVHCLALWTFQDHFDTGIFRQGSFQQKDILAQKRFSKGKFRHLNISAYGYFGTLQSNIDILAQTFCHLCYCAEISMCQNVPVLKCSYAKNSSCLKVLLPKSPHMARSKHSNVEMSICQNVCSAKQWLHVLKFSCDEKYMPKWLFPKSQVPK